MIDNDILSVGSIIAAATVTPSFVIHDLTITPDGVTYKGETIEDAGAVYQALVAALNRLAPPRLTQQQIDSLLTAAVILDGVGYEDTAGDLRDLARGVR